MSDKGLVIDNKPHELKLGNSFDPKSRVAYHSIRYDFKPASVDTTKEAQVDIGKGHHVTLSVPHVEGSGKTHTVYKGNKRPVSKECVLVIDHDTGTFTLERLTNNINVKKTRTDNSSRAQVVSQPLTPVESKAKTSPGKMKSSPTPVQKQPSPPPPQKLPQTGTLLGDISDSSSDSSYLSSDSDSDADTHGGKHSATMPTSILQPQAPLRPPAAQSKPPVSQSRPPPAVQGDKPYLFAISADLQLSDDSESDSD